MLERKDHQRWYSLSYESKKGRTPPAVRILVYEPCVDIFSELAGRHRQGPHLKSEFGFVHHETDLRKGFGFEGSIVANGVQNEYLNLVVPVTKKMPVAAAVSLSFLFSVLMCPEFFTEPKYVYDPARLQLLLLESFVNKERDLHSAPLGGVASPAFTAWVEKRYETGIRHFVEIERAMWEAWVTLSNFPLARPIPKMPHPYLGFQSRFGENGSFSIETLGNACDVSTNDWWSREKGRGHKMDCHNLDTPMQQLSLIAGLAALHDLASKDLDPRPPP